MGAGTNGRPGMVEYGSVGMSRGGVDGDDGDSGAGGGASDVGGGGGASLVGGGGGGSWVCVIVSGARVIVSVSGGGGDSGPGVSGGGAAEVGGAVVAGVVVTVVDDGDGVVSLLRSTNHTATAMAARSAIKPMTTRPTGLRLGVWYWPVSGSTNCIGGRGSANASVLAETGW